LVTGYLAQAHGLRPAPFLLGLAYAALGLGVSVLGNAVGGCLGMFFSW